MRRRSAARVRPGERVLAEAEAPDGVVAGTRAALYLADRRIPWEQVDAASWNSEAGVLTVTETAPWGEPQPVHRIPLTDAARLLELVRERVTATVVLQRSFDHGQVLARRSPTGSQEITWFVRYDPGADPADPAVAAATDAALAQARADVGE